MYARDTIAAIATPPGTGGVGIVRVSGDDAERVARRVFSGFPDDGPSSHRLYSGRVVDHDGRTIDRALGVVMRGPRSFTGEDVLEIQGHGGSGVVRAVLARVLEAGARAARRGEFSFRAVMNGRMDLAQAEALADLVDSKTDAARDNAVRQLAGELSREVASIRDALVSVKAALEVAIDFSEEDVGPFEVDAHARVLGGAGERLAGLVASARAGRRLREGARVAIVGRPNVGKSSLWNRLLGEERAIVTGEPGTTRDALEEAVAIGGVPVVLVDTAGIRESTGEAERLGIDRSRRAAEVADAVLFVVDASRPWEDEDAGVFDVVRHHRPLVVRNKIDLENLLTIQNIKTIVSGDGWAPALVSLSAKTGEGLDDLVRALSARLSADFASSDGSGSLVTRERQRAALAEALEAVERSGALLAEAAPPEVVSVAVSEALHALGKVTDPVGTEDVLDVVFSRFCIGK